MIMEKWPNSRMYAEYHLAGFDPQYAGLDWRSLRLVFEAHGSGLPSLYEQQQVHLPSVEVGQIQP
jgi:hypothetical protein